MAGLNLRWRRGGSRAGISQATAMSAVSTGQIATWLALAAIVLLALAARFYNVNWDDGSHIHPDERFLTLVTTNIKFPSGPGEYLDTNRSPLNPYNLKNSGSFVYGTAPVFLTKATADVLGKDNYNDLVLVGRRLSAIFGAATVLVAFLIGRRLYGSVAGLMAAVFLAFAPLAIQHSHFYVVDPFLAFFTTAALYFMVRIVQEGRSSDYVLAGLMLGIGAACKITALVLAPVLVLAVVVRLWPLLAGKRDWREAVRGPFSGLAVALLLAFFAFRVLQPYAFDTPDFSPRTWASLNQRWVDDQKQQSKLLGGEVLYPPSVQWIGRSAYISPLQDMVEWGMGPAFGVVGWLAVLYAGYRVLRYKEAPHLLPLAFVLVYFGFMGRQFSLYIRYFLPLYPVLAVLAGFGLVELYKGSQLLSEKLRRPSMEMAGAGVVGLVMLAALLAGLAYLSIYQRGFTRAEATRWMYANIPDGASIAAEEWDESLPITLPNTQGRQYRVYNLRLYEPDTPQKLQDLINDLDKADYVVISSNRLMNSIPRNPINYPVTSHYYEMLQSGALGFRQVAKFTSYPGLFGIDFPDHAVQESWSSYDHPRALIFAKAPDYSRARLEAALGHGPYAASVLPPGKVGQNGLLMTPAEKQTQQQGGTWTDVFSESGIVHSNPTLVWLLALEAAAFAVTPLSLLLFRRLSDRGYLLAKPLGLVLLAYPVWLAVSLKLVHFQQSTILAVLILLLLSGCVMIAWRRRELESFVRANWRLILFSEAVFLVAFFVFCEFRMLNPDLWDTFRGGEKPMDLAYLTAVTRSTTLPPYDPWFAGGYINYYYLGQFFTATLTKLTAIPPEVAFNLAVPTFFALTVAGAFSVGYNMAAAGRSLIRGAQGGRTRPQSAVARVRSVPGWSPYAAGLLAVFLVAVAGNLDGVGQLVTRLSAVSHYHAGTGIPVVESIVNSAGGAWQVLFHGAHLQEFDYWRSSRMMPPTISITEFPFFSFLFADLHAHMMAIAFQVLTIGICLALALRARRERDHWSDAGLVALLGLVVGSLRWLNSWDYPPFLLLAIAAVLIGERYLEGGAWASLQRALLKIGLLVGLSFLFYQPFLANYRAPVSGVISAPETTPIHQYLAHFGLFAAVLAAWLLFMGLRMLRAWAPGRRYPSNDLPENRGSGRVTNAMLLAAALLMVASGSLLLVQAGKPLVAALLPVLLIVAALGVREALLRRPDGGLRLFALALIALGLGLSIGVDLVTLKGDIVRMNTVFKFYLHIWVVFALATAFACWYLVFVVWRPALFFQRRLLPRFAAQAALAGLAILLLAVFIYPAMATPVRLRDRFASLPATLDGMEFMKTAVYPDEHGPIDLSKDYQGIEWMRHNVSGTPPIVEGRSPLYRWGGRFSIYTGLPTVLGWDWHQTQQRGDFAFMVSQRAGEVDAFYNDANVANAIDFLRRYGVQYVIVGQLEHYYYQAAGLAKFDSGLNGSLDVVFKNSQLTIYKVRPGVLETSAPSAAFLDPQ